MTGTHQAEITALYRYPVKGLSPESLEAAELQAGATILHDRIYAIENGPGRFDADNPRHLPKINFLMLMRNERLATLKSHFDPETHTLTIERDGRQVAKGALNTRIGQQMIEQFIAAYLEKDLRGPPRIVSADDHSFSDVAEKCVHIVNLASVRELERVSGRALNPLRFRANIYVDGLEPWGEFKWVGQTLAAGEVEFQVFTRTERCDAINVDPESGQRDQALPAVLERTFSHRDVGVYATVSMGGTVRSGVKLTMK